MNRDNYTGPWRLFAKSIPLSFHLSIFGIHAFDALSLPIPFPHDELLACLLFGGHPLQVHRERVENDRNNFDSQNVLCLKWKRK